MSRRAFARISRESVRVLICWTACSAAVLELFRVLLVPMAVSLEITSMTDCVPARSCAARAAAPIRRGAREPKCQIERIQMMRAKQRARHYHRLSRGNGPINHGDRNRSGRFVLDDRRI